MGKSQFQSGFKSRFHQFGDSIWSLKIRFDTNAIQFVISLRISWLDLKKLNSSKLHYWLWHVQATASQCSTAPLRRYIVCTPEYMLTTVLDPRYKLMTFSATVIISAVPTGLTPVKSVSTLHAKNMLLEYLHTVKTTITHVVSASTGPAVNTQVSVSRAIQQVSRHGAQHAGQS